jgi:hypothetical protein
MTRSSIFRLLVVLEIFTIPVLITLVFLDDRLLPTELAEWRYQDDDTSFEAGHIVQMTMGLFYMMLLLPSYIGLLMLKKWGSWIFLIAVLFSLVASLFSPVVMSGPTYSINSISFSIQGIILGMAFFSDVLDRPPESS